MYSSGFTSFGYRLTPWIKRLIVVNTVVFLLTWTGVVPRSFAFNFLGFNPSEALIEPWTILTYMFVHADFFHLFFNMLFLFFFGVPLEERWGGREFIKYYVICGLGGALFTVLFGGGTIVGASGAVYGILLAYALNWPDAQIWIWAIFPIKAKYLVMFLGAIAFFQTFAASGSDGIAHFAHLGGLVIGYVYLKKGWAVQARYESLKKRMKMRKFSVVPGGKDSELDDRPSSESFREARMLEEVDRLLDMIAAEGIESLSPEEREFLDKVSRMRQRGN